MCSIRGLSLVILFTNSEGVEVLDWEFWVFGFLRDREIKVDVLKVIVFWYYNSWYMVEKLDIMELLVY